jgi:hypothetical protein
VALTTDVVQPALSSAPEPAGSPGTTSTGSSAFWTRRPTSARLRRHASRTRRVRRWLRSDKDEEGPPIYEAFVAHPLVKLLFAGHLTQHELHAKLARHAARVEQRIAALESLRSIAPAETAGLGPSLLDLELRQLGDRLDWLREALSVPR